MDSSLRFLSMDELNKTALEQFVYQPVGRDMIAYLAEAAGNVIACDPTVMPPAPVENRIESQTLRSPEPRLVRPGDGDLPTLEEFITQLVVSSNVQVATLMSTLVYLNRLKSKLQPAARGLRCTAHRIFLASLILAAKYLNDSSPKNKHWANYSRITTEYYIFGFSRTEVNLMEKQLLFLLEWDLRITQEDLYRDLDDFLELLRGKIAERHHREMRHREEKRRQKALQAAGCSTPQHTGNPSAPITPPSLSYSRTSSSYASSVASSASSQAPTPYHNRSYDPSVSSSVAYSSVTTLDYSDAGSSCAQSVASSRSYSLDPPHPYHEVMKDGLCVGTVTVDSFVNYTPTGPTYDYRIVPINSWENPQHDTPDKKDRTPRRRKWGRLLGGSVAVK